MHKKEPRTVAALILIASIISIGLMIYLFLSQAEAYATSMAVVPNGPTMIFNATA